MIKVSIIIPVYNVEKYLDRCLSSIINQTFPSIEIILINDGSKDRSANICDNAASKDERVVVIHKKNEGPSAARNLGTKMAHGEYILYVDSDDELPLNAIETLIAKLKDYPQSEIIIGEIHSTPNDPFGYHTGYYKNIDYIDDNLWVRKHFYKTQNRLPTNPVNKLISTDFLKNNNLYFREGIIHEDELWMFYVAQKATKVAFVHSNTYLRYINPGSIMTGSALEKKKASCGIILEEIFKNISFPAFNDQFFCYSRMWMYLYPPETNENKILYDKVFNQIIQKAEANNLGLIAFLYKFYKKTYPILKGHGSGFVIWAITKLFYKRDV